MRGRWDARRAIDGRFKAKHVANCGEADGGNTSIRTRADRRVTRATWVPDGMMRVAMRGFWWEITWQG